MQNAKVRKHHRKVNIQCSCAVARGVQFDLGRLEGFCFLKIAIGLRDGRKKRSSLSREIFRSLSRAFAEPRIEGSPRNF